MAKLRQPSPVFKSIIAPQNLERQFLAPQTTRVELEQRSGSEISRSSVLNVIDDGSLIHGLKKDEREDEKERNTTWKSEK